MTEIRRRYENPSQALSRIDQKIRDLESRFGRLYGIDHGSLSGLGDDDHPQYLKLVGGTMTGTINLENQIRVLWKNATAGSAYFSISPTDQNVFRLRLGGSTTATDTFHIARAGDTPLITVSSVGDMLLYGDAVGFNTGTETTSYLQHSAASDYFRFVQAGSEAVRITHVPANTWLDVYGTGNSYIRKVEGTALIIDNEVANQDIFFRTDNGTSVKNRIFIDGSADVIKFYSHDGVESQYFSSASLWMTNAATSYIINSGAGSFNIENRVANTDIFLKTNNGTSTLNRVFIDGSADTIRFYDHNGSPTFYFYTTQLRAETDGTVALPTYTWAAQTNSGMYWVESIKRISFANQGVLVAQVASSSFVPGADNAQNLGVSGLRWVDVWAVDTSINSSDERYKKWISTIDEKTASRLVDTIDPIRFTWKGGKRRHWGFGAFQTRDALLEAGLDPADYGVFIDPMVNPTQDDIDSGIDDETAKAVRAGELLPVLWREVRTLRARVAALEAA